MDNNRLTYKVESGSKKWVIILGLLLVVAACGVLFYKMISKPNEYAVSAGAGACISVGGNFDSKHNECDNIDKAKCEQISGKFTSCGSSCRHMPKGSTCIDICESYCQL